MKAIFHLWLTAFYSWAHREIDPMSPDLGHVITTLANLKGGVLLPGKRKEA
jgi:hypothetical protein